MSVIISKKKKEQRGRKLKQKKKKEVTGSKKTWSNQGEKRRQRRESRLTGATKREARRRGSMPVSIVVSVELNGTERNRTEHRISRNDIRRPVPKFHERAHSVFRVQFVCRVRPVRRSLFRAIMRSFFLGRRYASITFSLPRWKIIIFSFFFFLITILWNDKTDEFANNSRKLHENSVENRVSKSFFVFFGILIDDIDR